MAYRPLKDYISGLMDTCEPPCLTLYQPTHRYSPDNQQDPILFGNLMKELQESLRRKYPAREVRPLLEPFQSLADDKDFWNHTLDGLAVFCAPGFFRFYRLQRPVSELAVVANSFHIRPLIRIFQSADRYQVLGLDRKEISLFEGNRDALDEIEPEEEVPVTLEEALGREHTEPHLTVASYGTGADGPAMYHGHGSRKEEVDIDTERFFRAVDKAVLEHHSQATELPLILAALPEYHTLFYRISGNPFLLDKGIDTDPDSLSLDELRKRAWLAFEPYYEERLQGLVEEFGNAKDGGLAAEDLEAVTLAAVEGAVATLLVEADRQVPGRIDAETGGITPADLDNPEIDDLLDELAEMGLRRGGRVVVIPAERMPSQTGAAAIRRF